MASRGRAGKRAGTGVVVIVCWLLSVPASGPLGQISLDCCLCCHTEIGVEDFTQSGPSTS